MQYTNLSTELKEQVQHHFIGFHLLQVAERQKKHLMYSKVASIYHFYLNKR